MSGEISDTSEMPFGKHKGKMMQDVPASYLHYIYHNFDLHDNMLEYIERSMDALKEEVPDLIWKRRR